jgi:hypothetical protein
MQQAIVRLSSDSTAARPQTIGSSCSLQQQTNPSSIQYFTSAQGTWFFHHSDVVGFVDALASRASEEVKYLCGSERLSAK